MMTVEEQRLETVAADDRMKQSGLATANLGYVNQAMSSISSDRDVDLSGEVAASDGDTTVSGSILQQHLNEISFFCGHPAVELRIAAVDLIGILYFVSYLSFYHFLQYLTCY
jgi:hypothetical protein